MKLIALLLFSTILIFLLSCTKENNNTTFKVRYAVTGDSVTQFKISQNGAEGFFVTTPFLGTLDTVIYIESGKGSTLKLDAIGNCANLVGTIDVDGSLRAFGSESDTDGDGITTVSVEYTIPK